MASESAAPSEPHVPLRWRTTQTTFLDPIEDARARVARASAAMEAARLAYEAASARYWREYKHLRALERGEPDPGPA